MSNSFKNHLYAIISGKSEVSHGKVIQAITLEKAREQAQRLKDQSISKSKKTKNQLWVNLT